MNGDRFIQGFLEELEKVGLGMPSQAPMPAPGAATPSPGTIASTPRLPGPRRPVPGTPPRPMQAITPVPAGG